MAQTVPPPASTLRDLVELVARLRAPDGCPWDREQRLGDLRAYLVEEAHETAAAIDQEEWPRIGSELGDLLFQVAFVLRLGEEGAVLTAEQVIAAVAAKFVERHPHVFGATPTADAAQVRAEWERRKLVADPAASLLAGVPVSLPSLIGAYRLSQKAAGVGFDWPGTAAVLDKVREELAEVESELAAAEPAPDALEGEIGDLLFTVANLARRLEIDPERALARANAKFRQRFGHLERRLQASGRVLGDVPLADLEALWQEAKGNA